MHYFLRLIPFIKGLDYKKELLQSTDISIHKILVMAAKDNVFLHRKKNTTRDRKYFCFIHLKQTKLFIN